MSSTAGINELAPGIALREIKTTLPRLLDWVSWYTPPNYPATRRYWNKYAGTHTHHTVTKLRDGGPEMLELAARVFSQANRLESQPWYPAFLGGDLKSFEEPMSPKFTSAATGQARFDFGMKQDRVYNQVVATLSPDENTRVIALRSVSGLDCPSNTRLAYTLGPTADVFKLRDGEVFWHHLVTTAGASILYGPLDRVLMNLIRLLGQDRKERQTYRDEAIGIQTMTREEWQSLADSLGHGSG